MKNSIKYILCILSLIFFLIILYQVINYPSLSYELNFYMYIKDNIMNVILTCFLKIITNLGSTIFLCILLIILLFTLNKRIDKIALIANLSIVVIINQVLKYIIKRPRPIGYRLVSASGYSFPSGHMMASIAFYGFLIYLINMKVNNKKIKYILISLLSIIIILIGFSRIYLGVHYLTDVIAGFLLGFIYLIIFIDIYKKGLKRYEK